ncbi:RNA polymerase sigma factor sigD, chloroplastic [Prosopis cineraria]|uniref:RNA polymerase sigma factor sigD, chloroplastic n=1 Tax=Prosopis cineraria TaxID=364024 RepID=UPI00240F9D1B|nr:RNA polymerase sigma factor sigD, chloroplastic [Prosopis cineraria]
MKYLHPEQNLPSVSAHLFHSFMAIASICSSPNPSPTLPTISLPLLPTFPSSKTQQYSLQHTLPTSSSPSKFGGNLVSGDSLSIAEAAETTAFGGGAMEAASNAASVASGIGNVENFGERENGGVRGGGVGLDVRRKRRRKRRKGLGFFDEEEHKRNCSEQRILIESVKSWCLSSKAEAELCLCLKEGARIEDAMLRITESEENLAISRKNPLGSRERNLDKVLCNTRESRERIARAYQGLVASIAADYRGKGLGLQDLMQEGTIGLLKGAQRFDPDKGFKLSTYVYWWIKQAIIKAVARKSRLVRLPGSKYEMIAKVAEANNALRYRLRRSPTYEEIAEVLDVNASTVRLISENSTAPISLDRTETDKGHMTLQEIIPGPEAVVPEKMFERKLMKEGVEKLLETLSKREAEIVRLYYGLSGQTPLSFEEIGRMLKLSRERVRQIHGVALSKLKHSAIINGLKYFAE